jgi:cell cycle checkpoint protein
MDRPAKRQRRSKDEKPKAKAKTKTKTNTVINSSSSPIEPTSPFALSTRPKQRLPTASPSPQKPKASPDKSKSLHSFFQPATESQRWAKVEKPTSTSITDDVEFIEDDYDSYDEIFTQHLANEHAILKKTREKPNSISKPKPKPKAPAKKTKRFLLPRTDTDIVDPVQAEDRRPWAQRYAPATVTELAVHKKKVSDLRSWLEDAFSGRRAEVSCRLQMRFLILILSRDYLFYEDRQEVERRRQYHFCPNQSATT